MQTPCTPEDYYAELGRVGGPDLVAFAQWAVANSSAHGLHVVWGDGGPNLKFAHVAHRYLPLAFGQLDKRGVLAQRQAMRAWRRMAGTMSTKAACRTLTS